MNSIRSDAGWPRIRRGGAGPAPALWIQEQIELLQRGLPSFAYSSFVPEERVGGSFLLDFFVTFFIKKESLKIQIEVNW